MTVLNKRSFVMIIVVIIVALLGFLLISGQSTTVSEDDPVVVRFLIGHEPSSLFDESNILLAKEMERLSGGTMTLEVLKISDFGVKGRDIRIEEIYKLMDEGKIDMATTWIPSFASVVPQTEVIDMPFLFKDYDAIYSFFEGEKGEQILADVTEKTQVSALAFTFSGGFRVIALLGEDAKNVADLDGMTIASAMGEVNAAGLEALGINVFKVGTQRDVPDIDGVEVAYTRFDNLTKPTTMRTVIETGHSVLATMMVADDGFFDALSEKQQAALKQAAFTSANFERDASIELADKTMEKLKKNGVSIITVSDEERKTLRDETSAAVYERFDSQFGEGYLQSVIDDQGQQFLFQ